MLGLVVGGGSSVALAACTAATEPQRATPPSAAQAAPPTPTLAAVAVPPTPLPASTSATAVATVATSAATAATPATAPQRRGGDLRIGQAIDIVTLDPHFYGTGTTDNVFLVYDRLTAYDLNRKPQPMLAESWDMSSDAKQLKLNLRKGVQFNTGRELTSDDVNYTLTRIHDPKIGVGQFAVQSGWFTSIETPDKYTAVLTSDQPRLAAFDFFEYLNIVDKNTLEGPDAKTRAVGTGPYTLIDFAQGDHLTYARNPNYWESGRPFLDSIHVSILRDPQAMMVQLEAGALDAVRYPSRQDFVRLRGNSAYAAIEHPVTDASAFGIGVNVQSPPMDNKLLRQALNYAVDRQRFVDTMLLGVGAPQSLPWSDKSPMYEASKMHQYPFDLDKARSLLAQSGLSDLSLDMSPSPSTPEGAAFAEMYQSDLGKLGIKLNIVKLEQAAWTLAANSHQYNGMYNAVSSNLHLSPAWFLNQSSPLKPIGNNEGFQDDRYTQLVANATTEVDPTKLMQVYSQINDLLLDESFVMYVSPYPTLMATRAGVHDMTPNLHGGWTFTDTWVEPT
jgi:peptide/nickel transport system substrate-binding protein